MVAIYLYQPRLLQYFPLFHHQKIIKDGTTKFNPRQAHRNR